MTPRQEQHLHSVKERIAQLQKYLRDFQLRFAQEQHCIELQLKRKENLTQVSLKEQLKENETFTQHPH